MKNFVFYMILILCVSCNQPDKVVAPMDFDPVDSFKQSLVVDIMTVVNKSPAGVQAVLGKPSKIVHHPKDCGNLDACDLEMQFKNGGVIVLFNHKQAKWFEFDHLDSLQWRNKPEIFGLKNMQPTRSTEDYDHYNGYPALKNIAFIHSKSHSDMIDYAIVTAR